MLLDTPICDFGWQAPDFTLADVHGNRHSMSEQLNGNGLLIAFICNHCPYVLAVAERLASDMRELQAEGINVLAIMPNDYQSYPQDNPNNMSLFAKKYDFSFAYLIDHDQSVARAYKAVCTPDFFGFNKRGELQYRGRLDDAKMDSSKQRNKELVNAMLQVAKTGQGPKEQFASMGCSIKWLAE